MNQQTLTACPNYLDFGIIPLGSSKTMQVVINNPQQGIVSNSTPQKMLLQVNTGGKSWLTVESKDPQILQPGVPEVVNVKVDTSSLKLGPQIAALTFIANGDTSSKSVEVPVTVNVSPLAAGLSFAISTNSSKTLPLSITNLSEQALNWQADTDIVGTKWLDLDRSKGTLQPHNVETVYVTAKSLQATRDLPVANLIFTQTGSGNKLATLPVQLHIGPYTDNGPKIATDQTYLYFDFVNDINLQGKSKGDKLLTIISPPGNGPVNWTVTSEVGWLTVDQPTGSLPLKSSKTPNQVKVKVTVDRSSLIKAEGEHRTDLLVTLTFTDPTMVKFEPTSRFILVKPFIP